MDDSTCSREELAARANELKAANPKWSWKRIAAELGTSERTLRRARDERPRGYLDQYQGEHLIKLPFHGGHVLTLDQDGKTHVLMKPAFDHLRMDADAQIRRIQAQPWAQGRTAVTTVRLSTAESPEGRPQEMITCDVRTFLMGLATVDARRVHEEARPLLIAYQTEVADVIERYWTQGAAINPRASEEQLQRAEEVIGDIREARKWEVLNSRSVRDIIAAASDYGTLSEDRTRLMFAGLRDRIHDACVGMKAKKILEARKGEIQQWSGKKVPTKADLGNAMNYLRKHELEDEAIVALDMAVELRYLVRRGGSYTVAQALSALDRSIKRMKAAGLVNPFEVSA